MGLRKESVSLLMKEGLKQPFHGRIITLGKQDVWCTYEEIAALARKVNYPLRKLADIELSGKSDMKAQGFISDKALFHLLGFNEILSLDASGYENADIIFDLNHGQLLPELKEVFDVVLDPGTIEHVFHVPNSLRNIFQMAKVDGRIIHISPSSNHIDHGFYMFSPTLFFDYYSANKFGLNELSIIQYKPQWVFPWKIAKYTPGAFNSFSFGGLDHSMYAIICIATKLPESTCDQVPQQYNFSQNLWNETQAPKRRSRIKNLVKKFNFLYKASLIFVRMFRQAKLHSQFYKMDV